MGVFAVGFVFVLLFVGEDVAEEAADEEDRVEECSILKSTDFSMLSYFNFVRRVSLTMFIDCFEDFALIPTQLDQACSIPQHPRELIQLSW